MPSQPNVVSVSIEKPSELKIALENRTFEIQMFWQRSNYFLVLITAIGVAVFTIKESSLATIMSGFGSLSSYYWYKTNLGSKFWQESWEVEVVKLASIEGIASFERSTADIKRQVEKSFEDSWEGGSKNKVHRYFDREISKKPSVSYYMILLSVASTLLWTLVTLILLWKLFNGAFGWAFSPKEFIGSLAGGMISLLLG